MTDPYFMEQEVDEPIGEFDNANDIEFEEENNEEAAIAPKTISNAQIDLDNVMTLYTGYGLMNRLLFIADVCPSLRFDALKLLIDYIKRNTQNVTLLMTVYQKVERAKQAGEGEGSDKIPPLDNNWVTTTTGKAQTQLEALLSEFKRQKDEAVKESVRRSLDEVFHQYIQMGNINEALKLFGRGMREYCTAPNYVLQMLISWINATIYANQWQKLSLLLPQAERAIGEVLDRENIQQTTASTSYRAYPGAAPTSTSTTGVGSAGGLSHVGKNYRELVRSSTAKIAAVNGLLKMHNQAYKQAAEFFITVDIDSLDYPQLLTASDVAIYGTLCALATFTRGELKERVLGSTLFRKFLESEPKLVELLHKFCKSEFGDCLDILSQLKDHALLNIFLAPHIQRLEALIRRSSIIQYFYPYNTANICIMAEIFRTTPDEMESELIDLIEQSLLNARVDSYGKILHAKFSDDRIDIYKRVMKLRKLTEERIYGILLRVAFQNHKIGVGFAEKPARRRRNGTAGSVDNSMDMDTTPYGETGSITSSGSQSSGNRVIAHVQRLWNVATSRIHPLGSSGSSSTSSTQITSMQSSSIFPSNGSVFSGSIADPGPPDGAASTASSPDMQQQSQLQDTTESDISTSAANGRPSGAYMETDDSINDM